MTATSSLLVRIQQSSRLLLGVLLGVAAFLAAGAAIASMLLCWALLVGAIAAAVALGIASDAIHRKLSSFDFYAKAQHRLFWRRFE